VVLHATEVALTPIGRAVVIRAQENPEVLAAKPLTPKARWVSAHSKAERERMLARAQALLARDYLQPGELVEVGEPENGYSYRLEPDRDVLARFCASVAA
jgi:hypothetical protein